MNFTYKEFMINNKKHKSKSFKMTLLDEYKSSKQKGKYLLIKKEFEKSLRFFKFAATLAWKYPILFDFVDDDLELELQKISRILIGNKNDDNFSNYCENRVVLYSGQIVDKGALTEQYLHHFVEHGYEVLLVVPDISKTVRGKGIVKYIDSQPSVTLFVPKSKILCDKIIEIRSKIVKFNPSKLFLHFMPNDVEGYCAIYGIKQTKFYIVHNDHTFWLGKGCSDYFIEFRDFGVSLSYYRRKIHIKRLLQIPFYPIVDSAKEFQGFPFNRQGKVVGVSGANLYKYSLDKELKFFHIIKELIWENKDFIFCLCGWGDDTFVKKFLFENKLEDRFYFLGRRDDFSEVVANSDILFESYPLKGGLVALSASIHRIPIIGIADDNTPAGSLEDFLSIDNYNQPNNIQKFKLEADKLIKDKNYRNNLGLICSNNKFNKNDFTYSIQKLLNNKLQVLGPVRLKPLKINDEEYLKLYQGTSDSINQEIAWMKLKALHTTLGFYAIIYLARIIFSNKVLINLKIVVLRLFNFNSIE